MQIKCDHLAPVRMATIKKSTDNTYWWGSGRKETLVHTEILQSLKKKKEWNSAICNNMDGPRAVDQVKQWTDKLSLYVESKKWIIKQKLPDRFGEQTVGLPVGRGRRGGARWGIKRHKLLCVKYKLQGYIASIL